MESRETHNFIKEKISAIGFKIAVVEQLLLLPDSKKPTTVERDVWKDFLTKKKNLGQKSQ